MAIPAGEIGVGAVSGAALVGFILKVLPVLLRRMNGKSNNNSNNKPGKAQVCIDRGNKLARYDEIFKNLKEALDENKKDHRLMFEKLDELK